MKKTQKNQVQPSSYTKIFQDEEEETFRTSTQLQLNSNTLKRQDSKQFEATSSFKRKGPRKLSVIDKMQFVEKNRDQYNVPFATKHPLLWRRFRGVIKTVAIIRMILHDIKIYGSTKHDKQMR